MSDFPTGFDSEADFAAWMNDRRPERRWFTWDGDDNIGGDISHMAIFFEKEQDPKYVNGILGYFFHGPWCGEYWGHDGEGGRLFIPYIDSTKSQRDDIGNVLPELWDMLLEGTPIRKTTKKGHWEAGTRKWGPVDGEFWIVFD